MTADPGSTAGCNLTDSSRTNSRRLWRTCPKAAEACRTERLSAETATGRTAERRGLTETKNAHNTTGVQKQKTSTIQNTQPT